MTVIYSLLPLNDLGPILGIGALKPDVHRCSAQRLHENAQEASMCLPNLMLL